MSDKGMEAKLDDLLSTSSVKSVNERLILIQNLINYIPKSDVSGLQEKIYNTLKVYLHSKQPELQKNALNLLYTCLQHKVLLSITHSQSLNLAYAAIFICINANDDLFESQEIWLKSFDTLEYMSDLYPVLCKNHGTRLLIVFQKALSVSYTTSVQKYKALQMLDVYISTVDIKNVKESLFHLCCDQVLPLAFSKNNENMHSLCLDISYRLLPEIKFVLHKYPEEWEKIYTDIRKKYIPCIERLISESNCTFAGLWVFLIKLIGIKFHKGSPVVNLLLSCIETAFKVPDLEVRKQSFFCWQILIEGFTIEPNETYTEKRIKLLTIPLKTNNGKTEELVKVKITVWCKLLEILNKNNLVGSFGVLDAYLGFCFGPLCEIPLFYYKDTAHGLISQGKKYSSLHLITCKTLLQLIGYQQYIDKELEPKLNILNFKGPAITTHDFVKFSKNIVDSVGESCVLLSQLEKSDRFECTAINEALWKSLFCMVDSLENEEIKVRVIHEISALIIALISVAQKKANLINFGLKPLFNIITSNEFTFFSDQKISKELFTPIIAAIMKKDKILLQEDVASILKKIFEFKRTDENYLEFINVSNSLILKEKTVNHEKLNILSNLWCIIEEELLNYLMGFDKNNDNEKLFIDILYEFLYWPIANSTRVTSIEKIEKKWRELYSMSCKSATCSLKNKLSSKLVRNIRDLTKNYPTNVIIAEYVYYIIISLTPENCDDETCEDITNIYFDIQCIVSLPSLSPDVINIYENCISHMLDTSCKLPYLHCLFSSLNSCLTNLLEIHGKNNILRSALLFAEKINNNNEKIQTELITFRKIIDKHKNVTDENISSAEVDSNIDKSEMKQALILLGHDINTMSPVKLKGSMLKNTPDKPTSSTEKSPKSDLKNTNNEVVFVNSPYTFDPKKLTKHQREKLSRRRDDIPALYQDLTQSSSQLCEFNSSNSESLIEQNEQKLEQPIQTKDNAENKTENIEQENLNKDSNEISNFEDIVQSDSEIIEINTRSNQRKSLNFNPLKYSRKNNLRKKTIDVPVKPKRGRKPKNAIRSSSDAIATQNGITASNEKVNNLKENMDVNKINSESENNHKRTRKRKSTKLEEKTVESKKTNLTDVIDNALENESTSSDTTISTTSSDTIISTSESMEPLSLDDLDEIPIKKRGRPKTKQVSLSSSPVSKLELKDNEPVKTDNKLNTSIELEGASGSQEIQSLSNENSLINLEANTELNKLENIPIHFGRPATISRRGRRVSDGNCNKNFITKKKNIIDYANLFVSSNPELLDTQTDEKVKMKVIRELDRIKLDIKHSEEYLKIDDRKTRISNCQTGELRRTSRRVKGTYKMLNIDTGTNDQFDSDNETRTILPNSAVEKTSTQTEGCNESEEADLIESSQEDETAINVKSCEVRALYPLDKIISSQFLQESDTDNRPKISPIKINLKSNKITTKNHYSKVKISENVDDKQTNESSTTTNDANIKKMSDILVETEPSENQLLIIDKLDLENISIATETESITSECAPSNNAAGDICESRKVILSNSFSTDEQITNPPTTPPKLKKTDNLPTSPVSNDTPTRTKELLEDTLEISPIKKVPSKKAIIDDIIPVITDTEKEQVNESPDLFESESTNIVSPKIDNTEKISGNTSQYSNRVMRKHKSRVLSGRSAKMMKMISAKQTFVPNSSTKNTTNKIDAYCSPSSNRTKKMMNNLEKCDINQDTEILPQNANANSEPIINEDDVLCFAKQLPSPFALPTGSILKRKRNMPEETSEETAGPVVKKRRVNFSDPPVSCLKFIEKTIKPSFCFSKHLPKELRITRSSVAEEHEISTETPETIVDQDSQLLTDIIPFQDVEIPKNTDDTIVTTKSYNNSNSICANLIENKEPISKIIAQLAHSLDFIEPVTTVLENKNIETIGDLAKLTELEVFRIPLKVEIVKSVLKEFYENSKEDSKTKPKRKIKPLALRSADKKTDKNTCEVSVIIENREIISESSSTIPVIEEIPQLTLHNVSSKSEKDYSENILSTESEKQELPAINKIRSMASISVTSPEVSYSPSINRIIVKSEFDSPTNIRDNILNEEYCKIKVSKFIQYIRNLFIEKKFDPRPIITSLFANNIDILKHMNCWEDLVKYIVRDIGIWALTKYLCSLKNIPALMIESILKNSLNEIGNDFICERLNKHEIIKFLSNEFHLIQVLQGYNTQTVYSTFFDLANDSQYSHLKYKEMLQELYACVIEPQINISQLLFNLDVVDVGTAIVKRMSDSNDMSKFLEKIYKSVPLDLYLKPTKPKELLDDDSTGSTYEIDENTSSAVKNIVHSIEHNQISKEDELIILRSLAKKWSALEFMQIFSQCTNPN